MHDKRGNLEVKEGYPFFQVVKLSRTGSGVGAGAQENHLGVERSIPIQVRAEKKQLRWVSSGKRSRKGLEKG